jgi:hypothetical protein
MGPEIVYLLAGAIVLLLATLAELPRFKRRDARIGAAPGQADTSAALGRAVTGQSVRAVQVGSSAATLGTSGSVSPEAFASLQTPAPGVRRRTDVPT